METDAYRDDGCQSLSHASEFVQLTEVSLRTTIWTHCGWSGATISWRRALQASHRCQDGLAVQESKDRCDVASFYTVASGKSSSE